MSGTQKKQKTNRNKSLYKQVFLFGRAYYLLRINLTLGVHSYAFGQALTAAAAPLKVRLIRSEHFFLSPEKKRVKMSGTQKNKRQIETNLYINRCFYSSELTICSELFSYPTKIYRLLFLYECYYVSHRFHLFKRLIRHLFSEFVLKSHSEVDKVKAVCR